MQRDNQEIKTIKIDLLFQQELKKYKNGIRELKKRGRASIYLGGYFIAVR